MDYITVLKPKKLALALSAILTTTAFSAGAAGVEISVDRYTPEANRLVTIADGTDVAKIRASVSGGVVTIDGKAEISQSNVSSLAAYAVAVMNGGIVDLGDGSTVNFSTIDKLNRSYEGAITVENAGSILKAKNLTINADGALFDGIYAYTGATLDLSGDTLINMNANKASSVIPGDQEFYAGIHMQDSTLNADNITINSTNSLREPVTNGIYITGRNSKTKINGDVTINLTSATEDTAVGMYLSGDAEFAGQTTITTKTTSAANDFTTGIHFLMPEQVSFSDITMDIQSVATAGHYVNTNHVAGLTQLSTGTVDKPAVIAIDNLSIKASGNYDVEGIELGTALNSDNTLVSINKADIQLKGSETATLNGIESVAKEMVIGTLNIQTEGGKRASLLNDANVRITGDVTLGSQHAYDTVESNNLYAISNVRTTSGVTSVTDISNNNKLTAWGRMLSYGNSIINIKTGDNSYLYSATAVEGTSSSKGTINLALNGSNSRWDMFDNSSLSNLTLKDATLNFLPPVVQTRKITRDASTFKTLTVNGNYVGDNGNIVMNSQLGDDTSPTDRLIVAGNTSGTTNVKVLNAGGSGGLTTDGIELITVGGDSDGEFKQNGRIVAGAYDYTLARGEGTNDKNWYLSSALSPEEPEDPADPVYPVDPAKPADPTDPIKPVKPQAPRESAIRPEAGLYGMNLQAANTLFNTRLQDRLGETHYVDALTGEKAVTSLWLRNVGGHTRQHDSSGQLDMQANRYVMQLGGDIAQWSSDNADRFHLGLMAGYANQKARAENQRNGKRASSDISGYSVGLYGTWLQDNETHEGAYVDTWAQYSWFDNSVNGRGVDEATKEYDAKGFTASVESGYTWKLADISERNALYIQPKAQVTWMGVKADEHKEANGTRVEGKGDGNIQTRLGVRLYGQGHNKLDDGKDRTFQPFVEANWIHNTKDFGVALNGENVDLTGTRNIGELKAGVEGQLTKNVALWGNVAQQIGDKGYSDTSAMLGVKVAF